MHQPRKRFGQHFLTDTNVLQQIINCLALQPNDRVVEIGPGQGALTVYLLPYLNHLDAVELDRDLVAYLQCHFDSQKLTVHATDALNFSYASLSHEPSDLRIVGNLPYNISTPLLFKLFSESRCIRDMHFMLQKEVVLRLTASVGSVDYNRLSVMAQYFCDNVYLFTVPPDAFNPSPKVESAIVRLTPKTREPLTNNEFAAFSAVVKEAFNYRRKKLGNCLRRLITPNQLATMGIDVNARPQEITLTEFIRIGKAVSIE